MKLITKALIAVGMLATGLALGSAASAPANAGSHVMQADLTGFCPTGYGELVKATRTGVNSDGEPVFTYTGSGLSGAQNFEVAGPQGHDGIFYTFATLNTRVGVNGNWGITKWRVDGRDGSGASYLYDLEDFRAAGGDKATSLAQASVFGTGDDINLIRACIKPT